MHARTSMELFVICYWILSQLWICDGKVAPLKPVTIPQMESATVIMESRTATVWRRELQMELRLRVSDRQPLQPIIQEPNTSEPLSQMRLKQLHVSLCHTHTSGDMLDQTSIKQARPLRFTSDVLLRKRNLSTRASVSEEWHQNPDETLSGQQSCISVSTA